MSFSVATAAAALFLLFTAASCAPTAGLKSQQDACEDARRTSLELNHIARSISAVIGTREEKDFQTSLVWMEANDMCDPKELNKNPTTCIEKILRVLMSYIAEVDRVAGFQNCSEFASKVMPVMKKLRGHISTCGSVTESHNSIEETQPLHWHKALLCHYTMERLFSFSILTARVFAVGNPARHADGPQQICK